MSNKKYTNQDIEFIKKHYPHKGSKYCAKHLNRSYKAIIRKASKLKIKLTSKRRSERQRENVLKKFNKTPEDIKLNEKLFIDSFTNESAYLLGFMWADGYIRIKPYQEITTKIQIEDALELFPIFQKTGPWKFYYQKKRQETWKDTGNICSCTPIAEFLYKNGYIPKRKKQNNLISIIPKDKIPHYIRGIIDGDGCWYINSKLNLRQFSIVGHIEQNWEDIKQIFKEELNIDIKIKYRKSKKNYQHSFFRITKKQELENLGNFIYKDFKENKIGLQRKYNKWKQTMESYK